MKRNVALLNQVMDFIEENPKQHDQGVIWSQNRMPKPLAWVLGRQECGSTGCFAGWAVHFSNPGKERRYGSLIDAMFLLGLTPQEADWMFSPIRTRAEQREFVDTVTAEDEAKRRAAAARRAKAEFDAMKVEAEEQDLVEVDVTSLERVLERV